LASRKRYSTAEVLKELDLSDEEQFDENDSDRDSDTHQDDDQLLGDALSEATDAYHPPISDSGNDTCSSDSESVITDAHVGLPADAYVGLPVTDQAPTPSSLPVFMPRVWERVDTNYTPKVDFAYSHTAGM